MTKLTVKTDPYTNMSIFQDHVPASLKVQDSHFFHLLVFVDFLFALSFRILQIGPFEFSSRWPYEISDITSIGV